MFCATFSWTHYWLEKMSALKATLKNETSNHLFHFSSFAYRCFKICKHSTKCTSQHSLKHIKQKVLWKKSHFLASKCEVLCQFLRRKGDVITWRKYRCVQAFSLMKKKNSLNLQCRKKILKCFTIALLGLQQNQRFYFYISP